MVLCVPEQVVPAPDHIPLGRFAFHPVRGFIPRKPGAEVGAQLDKIEISAALFKKIFQLRQVFPLFRDIERADISEDQVHIVFYGQ